MAENEVKEIQNAGEQAVPNKAVPQKTVKDKEPISAENAAKQAALKAALAQIEKQFGKGAVMKLGETTALNVESISTGSIGP